MELANDPDLRDKVFLVKLGDNQSPGGIIPFKALEVQWVSWWNELVQNLDNEKQLSEATKEVLRTNQL